MGNLMLFICLFIYLFSPEELNCLLALRLAPNVTTSLLERISELHISHRGLKSNIAELKYLETASKLSLYGQHQFHVKDAESTHIILSVYSGGITIFEKGMTYHCMTHTMTHNLDIIINRFAWPAIIELSYKRSVFYIQVRAGSVENTNARIGFLCPTSGTAKRIWRITMEHHHFFRKECSKPETQSKNIIKSRTQTELRNELYDSQQNV